MRLRSGRAAASSTRARSPSTGFYTILVDPQGTDLGSMTLTLYDVPPDLSGSIAIGGPPVSLALGPVPGQNATLSFTGTAAQRVNLRLSNVTLGEHVVLRREDLASQARRHEHRPPDPGRDLRRDDDGDAVRDGAATRSSSIRRAHTPAASRSRCLLPESSFGAIDSKRRHESRLSSVVSSSPIQRTRGCFWIPREKHCSGRGSRRCPPKQ